MQIRSSRLSRLRQKLIRLQDQSWPFLSHFLEGHPITKGSLYALRRKCGKSSCRCAKGQRHVTMVLSVNISGRTRLWTIPQERIEEIRLLTERYRRFRRARANFIKFHSQRLNQMLRIIDAIERTRKKEP